MHTIAFQSRPLRPRVAKVLHARLRAAHRAQPFSALDPRQTVRRVTRILDEMGVEATVYRGGLDLRGSEVDHIWLDVDGRVVDVAFPLFVADFVDVLRRYVAGDADPDDIAVTAADAGVDERVVGLFPAPLRYLGRPVWSARQAPRP